MTEIKVSGCDQCPFVGVDVDRGDGFYGSEWYWWCSRDNRSRRHGCPPVRLPTDCPLRSGPVTVVAEESND